jgi:type IV pilus assembly protein PilV
MLLTIGKRASEQMKSFLNSGFSMIEVLVSILVLAVGVIGAAGMQLSAMRTSKQSVFQTNALQLASEMADRMRANDAQMKQKDGANLFLSVDYKSASEGEPPSPKKFCYESGCDAAELAQFDIYEWEKRLKQALPGGRVRICRDASPWNFTSKSLTWNCGAGAADNASLVIKVGWQLKNPDGTLVKDNGTEFPPSVALTVEPYIQ